MLRQLWRKMEEENRTLFSKKMERYLPFIDYSDSWIERLCQYCFIAKKIFLQEEEIIDGEDTMKDLRTTFAGIFGERKWSSYGLILNMHLDSPLLIIASYSCLSWNLAVFYNTFPSYLIVECFIHYYLQCDLY